MAGVWHRFQFSTPYPKCVCVYPLESQGSFWIVLAFNIFVLQQEDHPCAVCDGPTKRPQYMRISRLITVTYLRILYGMRLSQEPHLQTCTPRRHLVGSSLVFSFWALLPLEDLQDPVVRTCTLRNWNPGRRVAPLSVQYAYP